MAIRSGEREGLHVATLLFQYHVGRNTAILCLSVPVSIALFAISLLLKIFFYF